MDIAHGVLLLLIGLPFTFLVFAVILWVEQPEEDKDKDLTEVEKSIRDLFRLDK